LVRGAGYKSLMAQPSQGSAERGRAQELAPIAERSAKIYAEPKKTFL